MKLLYVIYSCGDESYVSFHAVEVETEDEKEFKVIDKMEIENYEHVFPKDKINHEFDFGFVTEELDKTVLRSQLDRVYNNLKEKHLKNGDEKLLIGNDRFYKGCIKDIEECIVV